MIRPAVVGLAAFALIGAAPHAPRKASKAVDWTKTVVDTPDGGFRMGNPKAKITIVEYGSLTCPHCRHFAETAMKPLLGQYVRTGKASYEYRSLVLNGIDIAATLVARCGGAAHFFPVAEELYADVGPNSGRSRSLACACLTWSPPSEETSVSALGRPYWFTSKSGRTRVQPVDVVLLVAPGTPGMWLSIEAAKPPSTMMFWPVTYAESRPTRNAMVLATSSGVPTRRSGMRSARRRAMTGSA